MLSFTLLFVFVPAFARSTQDSLHAVVNDICAQNGMFWCPGSSTCLDSAKVCNGIDDCGDAFDELNCKPKCSQEALVACAYPTSVDEIKFATKKEDLDKLCPNLHIGLRCIDNYTRVCLEPEQRSHFNKLYAGTSMVIQEICQPGHYQEEFLRHAPCMNRLTVEYELCVSKYESELHNLSQEVDKVADGLKKICGNLHDLLTCSKRIVKKTCGEETATFAAGFLDRMADSLIRRHCREHGHFSSSTSQTVPLLLLLVSGTVLNYLFT